MKRWAWFISISIVAAALTMVALSDAPTTRLDEYVAKSDPSFSWRVHARHEVGGSQLVELRLHSQSWRDTLWKHRLFVIKPPRVSAAQQGMLILGGGRWRDAYDADDVVASLSDDTGLFLGIATRLETVVAVLAQVPFQPLFGLTEDQLIAHSFEQFLTSGDPEWPLLLPMVKSAARAMDATQAFVAAEWNLQVDDFTVVGGSKRGWTAWLTAAVDPRVTGIVPMVIDALNMEQHFPYQTRVWGQPSEQIRPYTERNLHNILAAEEGRVLREIVDPFSYRERLKQPKIIVIATNDEYFPIDASNLYWNGLQGPKYLLVLPNQGHSADDFGRLIPALSALQDHLVGRQPLPEMSWVYEWTERGLRLCMSAVPAPVEARYWSASSADRDFRDAVWSHEVLAETGTRHEVELVRPDAGYAAGFAELAFEGGGSSFVLATNLAVLGAPGAAELDGAPSSDAARCP